MSTVALVYTTLRDGITNIMFCDSPQQQCTNAMYLATPVTCHEHINHVYMNHHYSIL